ncbi:very short patch repair endonuclease [Flavobacterium sp. AG291]|uniref:very short patch repair endonuclease n=1 Tax=Flavobacterium sp. AG291 TaxID=2184000 RepID=UPI000E0BC3A3|nr:very short patch repair endonuclease [Flavobacterium sp. AG291]RDI05346.1 T/G mismatch-specific endonuclease [Flavobacterium sp. AG291]
MKKEKQEMSQTKRYIFETTLARSKQMSKIKCKNTKPEMSLRKALWKLGIRYRLNVSKLPGKPDIVIERKKIVIFLDGEFWHGFDWENKKDKIKANRDYWIPKIEKNMMRDFENNKNLELKGYKVLRFWAQEIHKNLPKCVSLVLSCVN